VNLIFAFIFTALFFKHPSYVAEREYRFIIMTRPTRRITDLKKRPNKTGRNVGYFEFDWKAHRPAALKIVKIGPAQKEARGRRVVISTLNQAGLSAGIEMSDMPAVKV
jgi:hypothetical protein